MRHALLPNVTSNYQMKISKVPSNLKNLHQHWTSVNKIHDLMLNKDWFVAVSLCNQLIELVEYDFFGFYYRGQCNVKIKLFEEAISDFEISLVNLERNRFPSLMKEYELEVKLRISNIFRLTRKYDKALSRIDELLREYPDYAEGHKEKAGVLSDMGDLKTAFESANQGLKLNPGDQELERFKNYLAMALITKE